MSSTPEDASGRPQPGSPAEACDGPGAGPIPGLEQLTLPECALALIGSPGTHYHLTQFKIRDLLAQVTGVDFSVGTTGRSNRLIAALPEATGRQWFAESSAVEMRLGDVLHESGRTVSHVYFPTTSIVSPLYTLKDGASTEIAVVGNEGIVGISALMGGNSPLHQSVVRREGQGLPRACRQTGRRARTGGPGSSAPAAGDPGAVDDAGSDLQHAGCAPRRRDRGRDRAATGRADSIPAGAYLGRGPPGPRISQLRVLRGDQQGIRPIAGARACDAGNRAA